MKYMLQRFVHFMRASAMYLPQVKRSRLWRQVQRAILRLFRDLSWQHACPAGRALGKNIADAAIAGAALRFRPVMMTGFAFIFGLFPLVIAHGAGAATRHAVGTPAAA
jgi:AcrB/AcrD/AcrF family